jgi:hypothetical protein
MNHLQANGWKELINREAASSQQWKTKNAQHIIDAENRLLLESFKNDQRAREQAVERQNDPMRQILCNGVSKEGAGRAAYLKERSKLPPMDKNPAPATASQEYGWRPAMATFDKLEFGRKPVITSSFYRGRGVFKSE